MDTETNLVTQNLDRDTKTNSMHFLVNWVITCTGLMKSFTSLKQSKAALHASTNSQVYLLHYAMLCLRSHGGLLLLPSVLFSNGVYKWNQHK